MGILFLHSLEHFQLFVRGTELIGPFSEQTDKIVMDACSFLFQSKAYVIFALMFGFSFWLQYQNRIEKGSDFTPRFLWRMFILLGFGFLHMLVYSADILAIYALLSVFLIVSRKWPDWVLVIFAAFLLIEPFYMVRLYISLNNPEVSLFFNPPSGYWRPLYPLMQQESLLELIKGNLQFGWKAMPIWSWEHGRLLQTPGLFILGMLAARRKIFTPASFKFYAIIFVISLFIFLPLHEAREHLKVWTVDSESFRRQLRLILEAYSNLAQAFMWVSLFCIVWKFKSVNSVLKVLAPFGKMSLTNYVFMSVMGVFAFHGVGLGLYRYLGTTMSLFYALAALASQLIISHVWLKNFKYGPLEYLWRKLSWIGYKK